MAISTVDRTKAHHHRSGGTARASRAGSAHHLPVGVISLASSAVGMGALIVVVQGRSTDADSLPAGLSVALLAISVAGLVLGGLTGILALARPGGAGQRTSGMAVAGLLVSVWFMALGLEVLALLGSSSSADTLDRADPSAPGVVVMAVVVLAAAVGVTVQVVRHVLHARTKVAPGPSRRPG